MATQAAADYTVIMAEKSLRQLILDMGRNFSDQLRAMDAKFDLVDQRFESIDKRFDVIDKRFEVIDQRFDRIDQRLNVVDQRLNAFEQHFDHIDQRLNAFDQRFDHIEQRLEETDKKLDTTIELVLDMQRNMVTKAEWREVKTDTKVIKFAVTHLSEQLTRHIKDKHIHVNV